MGIIGVQSSEGIHCPPSIIHHPLSTGVEGRLGVWPRACSSSVWILTW